MKYRYKYTIYLFLGRIIKVFIRKAPYETEPKTLFLRKSKFISFSTDYTFPVQVYTKLNVSFMELS